MSVNEAYKKMATSGLYAKPPGLKGKYDNVRRFWEDKITAYFLRPFLEEAKRNCLENGQKVRIMDLGCGSGDGYELLTEVVNHDASPQKVQVNVLPEDEIDLYVGVDLNSELLEQGRGYFGNCDNVKFLKGDFIQGLGVEDEPPFDIYLANYGTLSHCTDEEVEQLLVRIINHGGKRTLFMGDWLGAYSYEWQNWWANPLEKNYSMPYVVSYLYEEEERPNAELESFDMRLMDRPTLFNIINRVSEKTGVEIKVLRVFDRSTFVGRHIETGDYLDHPQKIRTAVNSLLEPECRTNLEEVKVSFQPREGFPWINEHFKRLEQCWNGLVDIAENILAGEYDYINLDGEIGEGVEEHTKDIDEFLSISAKTLTHLMRQSRDLPVEDIRANIIEPQLAYLLRRAEMVFQEGLGMGHGFTAILEINR